MMLTHSAYYLTEYEWAHIASIDPTTCTMVVHPPQARRGIPADAPEFTFGHPADNTSVLSTTTLIVDAYREYMLGRPAVVFKPNGPHGTMYHHDAMIWLSAGGFHSSVFTRFLDHYSRDWKFCFAHTLVIIAAFIAALVLLGFGAVELAQYVDMLMYPQPEGFFSGLYRHIRCTFVTCYVPSLSSGLLKLVAALSITIGTWWHMLMVRACVALTVAPGLCTDLTLSTVPYQAFDWQGEVICDVFKLVFSGPITLTPVQNQSFHVVHEAYTNALTILAMGAMGPPKQLACLATLVRRHNVASPVAYNAVTQATERLNVYRLLFEAPTTITPSILSVLWASPGLCLSMPFALVRAMWNGLLLALPFVSIVMGLGVSVLIAWIMLHGIPLVSTFMASHLSGATGWAIV